MVHDRWNDHQATLQHKLKTYYKEIVQGMQLKIVQDRRSNMLRLQVDIDTLPKDLGELVDMFDHGMVSRITFHHTTPANTLKRFGERFYFIAAQYLRVFQGIVVCISSTTPLLMSDSNYRNKPASHRMAIFLSTRVI